MRSVTKILRHYQGRLLADMCRATGDVLVEQPTGSGKTMQIVTLVAMQLGRRFTHALISAPQEQIEHGFVHRDYQKVAWPGTKGVAINDQEVPEEIIWGARQSQLGSVKRLLAYLRQAAPVDHALACTHAALNHLSADALPDDLSGKALFLDEAHHASADGLSEVISVWRERGGQLFFFTATPYRGDGRPVALEGMRLFRRSLAEHMAEGFAPGQLDSEIVALGNPGDSITPGQFTGEDAPPPSYFDGLVQAICRKWLDDDKPKAIVRVPPMRGGSSGLISRLINALPCPRERVLNATGTGAKDQQRFLAALESERNRTCAESTYDIIVGIQRVMEGTDWPVCSAVYCVGMPGSLNTVVQLLGRAMRPKGDDYPSSQRDRARLVFFVPCGGGSALADLSLDHSRHALLTCCFLADHEVGQEWIVLREVRRGIEDALGSRDENPAAADAENEANAALDPEVRAEVELVMASAREQIISAGSEPTLGEVVQLAAKTRPDLPEAALHRVAAEILASQPGSSGAETREVIHNEVAKRLRIDPMVKNAMEEAFAVVLKEFRAATLKDSAVLECVGRQVHGVTGGQMREFAQRLRNATPGPLTEEQILAWADVHLERTGDWPKVASGPISDAPGETWNGVHTALRVGLRGLPGGSSLAQLLTEKRGARNIQDLPSLTEEIILELIDRHYEHKGGWPNLRSDEVLNEPGETWRGIDNALRLGLRGLPGGSSLPKLLASKRGVRNIQGLPLLSETGILELADRHREETGEWPTAKSGPVAGAEFGETWKAIDVAIRQGLRGLAGGSSLAKLLSIQRGVRNSQHLPNLTEEQILGWADAHHGLTGKWPNKDSGAITGTADDWRQIDSALRKGLRGLSGGSSLAQLLAEHRGARNLHELPSLSVDQILGWADAHRDRTDQWPTQYSGPIQETPEETWAGLNYALGKGGRGLPGGSSLAELLADHRDVRNQGNLPPLSKEQVLAWADAHYERTGEWPDRQSGPIPDSPGDTWRRVDNALRYGLRGMVGGSSLARLLAADRSLRNRTNQPRLREETILAWAEEHHERTARWPSTTSGPVESAAGEKWANIDAALREGRRGLPGGSSLARLIKEHRERSSI